MYAMSDELRHALLAYFRSGHSQSWRRTTVVVRNLCARGFSQEAIIDGLRELRAEQLLESMMDPRGADCWRLSKLRPCQREGCETRVRLPRRLCDEHADLNHARRRRAWELRHGLRPERPEDVADPRVRHCFACGKRLSRYNLNDRCFACLERDHQRQARRYLDELASVSPQGALAGVPPTSARALVSECTCPPDEPGMGLFCRVHWTSA
jgi:hypothetical protein